MSADALADILERERKAFFNERCRAVATGIIEPFGGTFFLLIAIKYFHAGDTAQAMAATGGSAGLMLGPLAVYVVRRAGWRVNRALGGSFMLTGAAFFILAMFPSLGVYLSAGLAALVTLQAGIPLATQFYQQNYRPEIRGSLFSVASTIRVAVVAVVTWVVGEWLNRDIGHYQWMGVAMGLAAWTSGMFFLRSPGQALVKRAEHRVPYQALLLLGRDRAFTWLIAIWMFMGFGNLMMVPLRIKYLVEPQFGIGYSEAQTAVIVGVIPAVTVFCLTWWWGRLFDRVNFFVLRAILNFIFLVSNVFFFLVNTHWGFVVGAVFLGLAFAGGNVAWSLWVTKIAPAEKVADYMSVHTFATGLRGIAAPMLSVPLSAIVPMGWLVAMSSALILISLAMLGPELHNWRRRRAGQPLVDESPEK